MRSQDPSRRLIARRSRALVGVALGAAKAHRIVDMAVSRLRQRLRDTEKPPRLIRTVRGVGYLVDK